MFGNPHVTVIMSSATPATNSQKSGTNWMMTCFGTAIILGFFAMVIVSLVDREAGYKIGIFAKDFGNRFSGESVNQSTMSNVSTFSTPSINSSPQSLPVIPLYVQQTGLSNPIIDQPTMNADTMQSMMNTYINGKMLEEIQITKPLGHDCGDAYVVTFNRNGRPEFYRTWKQDAKNIDQRR